MNRRQALGRLAAGGLAAAGAGAVRTLPAFAAGAPVVTTPFTMQVVGTDSPMSVILQPGAATCPGSALPCEGCAAGAAENMVLEVTASVVSTSPPTAQWGWGSDGVTAMLPGNEFTFSPQTKSVDPATGGILDFIKLRGDGSGSLRKPLAGEALLMQGRAVYRCSYAGGSYDETTEIQTVVFTFDGADWQPSAPPG